MIDSIDKKDSSIIKSVFLSIILLVITWAILLDCATILPFRKGLSELLEKNKEVEDLDQDMTTKAKKEETKSNVNDWKLEAQRWRMQES